MHIIIRRLRTGLVVAAVAAVVLALSTPSLIANNPRGARYCSDTDHVFWFVQTSDTHIGSSGSTDANNLRWLVTTARSVIKPLFTVVTGDLTDSTNGNFLGIPNGPYQTEWNEYKNIVDPAVTATDYFDIPGNHDAYNDKTFAYYRANSVQGRASGGQLQLSWTRVLPFGTYHFLGVNTADNTGAKFSLTSPYGDHAGLDTTELSFIETKLADNAAANLTFVFGHHPVTATGTSTDTYLYYGQQQFISDLDRHQASAYGYGHTHASAVTQFTGNTYTGTMSNGGIRYVNVASLGKSSSGQYTVFAVDCDGVSQVPANVGTWPVVMITAPVSKYAGSAANPFAYSVPNASNPIRALVFDSAAVSNVVYRVDGASTWTSMTPVAGNAALWTANWDATNAATGSHTIEVKATGSSTVSNIITVDLVRSGNVAPSATNDSYTITQDKTLTVAAPGVLNNDTDADGNTMTAVKKSEPQHGAVALNANGSFTYTPATGFVGTDSFTYAASDGLLESTIAVVTLTVTAAPVTDTVTITRATYSSGTRQLSVTATSSQQPNVTLTVKNYGTMTWKAASAAYTYVKKTSKPASVTVTSTGGDTATATVTTVAAPTK